MILWVNSFKGLGGLAAGVGDGSHVSNASVAGTRALGMGLE